MAAFGEIGLTGRLRVAAQAERRLEECRKLGVSVVVAPEGTTARGRAPAVQPVETLRQALAAGLERPVRGAGNADDTGEGLASVEIEAAA